MRKALVVGINYYENVNSLFGCVNDATSVTKTLNCNYDDSRNFYIKTVTAYNYETSVTRKGLKNYVEELFRDANEIALFYFAGHGHRESAGGYLLTSDSKDLDDGLPMRELIDIANNSPASNRIILLDCCHSGEAGNISSLDSTALLSEGLTILAASQANQYAEEKEGKGLFTTLFVDALQGKAASMTGEISLSGIYAHIDHSLGAWEQRPVYKANTAGFVSLRRVAPRIPLNYLRKLNEYFPSPDFQYLLDPSYESTNSREMLPIIVEPYADPTNVKVFGELLKLASVGLVAPVKELYMYFAAMQSSPIQLTQLGKHYWDLIEDGKI